MDVRLWVAAISAAVTIALTIWTTWWTGRQSTRMAEHQAATERELASMKLQHERQLAALQHQTDREMASFKAQLEEQASDRHRAVEARAVLDRYRKPLLVAAEDLRSRIGNIRHQGFLYYLQDERRGAVALRSTLFRLANFLGWVETLSRQVAYLHFETDEATKATADSLSRIARTLATDRYDRGVAGPLMMLWREEQRAIGGLMQTSSESVAVMGFEGFDALYDEHFAHWLDAFAEDLRDPLAAKSRRLELLERYLAQLVTLLDEEGIYAKGP